MKGGEEIDIQYTEEGQDGWEGVGKLCETGFYLSQKHGSIFASCED